MSSIERKDNAVAMGILWTLPSIMGYAPSSSVSGAIWHNVVPTVLEASLPSENKHLAKQIFGSLPIQLQNPLGSPIRNAVIAAYWAAQQKMVIVGTCLVSVAIAAVVMMWENINVKNHEEDETTRARGVLW